MTPARVSHVARIVGIHWNSKTYCVNITSLGFRNFDGESAANISIRQKDSLPRAHPSFPEMGFIIVEFVWTTRRTTSVFVC